MAENSGRGNTIDAVDGPKGGNANPPPVSDTVKDSVKESSRPEMEGGGVETGVKGKVAGSVPNPRTGDVKKGDGGWLAVDSVFEPADSRSEQS